METAKRIYADQEIITFKGKTQIDCALLRAVCSALYSMIAVGGLFLGYLLPGVFGKTVAGGQPILHGSLLGVIVESVRGSLKMPSLHGPAGALPAALYFLVFALVGVIVLSLVLSILAFLRPKRAKRYANLNGTCVFLVYLTLFFSTLFCRSYLSGTLERSAFDLPTLLTALAALFLLALSAIAERGLDGGANVMLLLWSCAALFAFVLPASPLGSLLLRAFSERTPSAVCCLAGSAILLLNLLLSVSRLHAARGRYFDVFRFGCQILAALVLAAVCLSEGMPLSAFFSEPLTATLFFLAPASAFLLSVFAAARRSVLMRK